MKPIAKGIFILLAILSFLSLTTFGPSLAAASGLGKPNAVFDVNKMGDMSDFDPNNPVIPTGDTIKIACVASHSGPAAQVGQMYWMNLLWVAHDINKRGGIFVDGKKKLLEIIKADTMSKADQCKKVCERMILQEKVNVLWGTDGSNMMKVINETANKYKVIAQNAAGLADDLQDATNFSRYAFMSSFSTEQIGRGLAYYYGQIRKKEKKFYILCQDYMFGHAMAEGFKKGLKEYYPQAQIVGEDYHKLFLTDFAPYLTKIKASGAEVVYTGDWVPDAANLLKQARQMGITLPFAHIFMDEPNFLHDVGVEGTKGLVQLQPVRAGRGQPILQDPGTDQILQNVEQPLENQVDSAFQHPPLRTRDRKLRLLHHADLLAPERYGEGQEHGPEKIIKLWEGDSYQFVNGKILTMRPCDHKAIQDLHIFEFVPSEQQKVSFNIPPYYWYQGCSNAGPTFTIPAEKALPLMDQNLDRCKGKNAWGN